MTIRKKGFTLIELLVVIAIIGILTSVALASLNSARAKARDAKRSADIKQIQTALEMYYTDNGQYPPGGWSVSNSNNWDTLKTSLEKYIPTLPIDPNQDATGYPYNGAHAYGYFSSAYGCPEQWYMLVYTLETASGVDPGVTACDGTPFKYGGPGANTTIKTVGANGK